MGILAISEYIRHGKRNVFIVFQMAALLFVLCVSASTLLAEYRLYRPFAQLNHKEGLYLSASGYHGANPDAIAKGMEKVDYVLAIGTQNLLSKEAANGINVAVYPNQRKLSAGFGRGGLAFGRAFGERLYAGCGFSKSIRMEKRF